MVQVDDIALVTLKSEVLVFEVAKALNHERGPRHQYQRQCGLHHDQDLLREGGAVCGRATGAAQRLRRIAMRRDPGRRNAEHHARHQGEHEREQHHRGRRRRIDGDEVGTAECNRQNTARPEIGDDQSGSTADDGEQCAFREHLANQPGSSRSQRQTHGSLQLARRSTRQQQVGDVRTSDQQHQSGERHQQVQALLVVPGHLGHATRRRNHQNFLLRDSATVTVADCGLALATIQPLLQFDRDFRLHLPPATRRA